jgi:hypothetical protein
MGEQKFGRFDSKLLSSYTKNLRAITQESSFHGGFFFWLASLSSLYVNTVNTRFPR